jgi:hypothetical protein
MDLDLVRRWNNTGNLGASIALLKCYGLETILHPKKLQPKTTDLLYFSFPGSKIQFSQKTDLLKNRNLVTS